MPLPKPPQFRLRLLRGPLPSLYFLSDGVPLTIALIELPAASLPDYRCCEALQPPPHHQAPRSRRLHRPGGARRLAQLASRPPTQVGRPFGHGLGLLVPCFTLQMAHAGRRGDEHAQHSSLCTVEYIQASSFGMQVRGRRSVYWVQSCKMRGSQLPRASRKTPVARMLAMLAMHDTSHLNAGCNLDDGSAYR